MTPSAPLIYARLSPRDGDAQADLDRMVAELQEHAGKLGWPEPEVIAERDVSAWWGNTRKGRWDEVIEGLGTRWDGLLVRSLDRSARDIVETVNLVRLYGRGGFEFASMNGDTLDDPKSATIRGLVSQWESDEKSYRLKLKWADKANKGQYHPGRYRPFGYQYVKENGKVTDLVIDPVEAEIVREVAQRVIAGESLHSIAVELDGRVSSVSGGNWQRIAVKRILKPAVAGLREHHGEELPGNWPAILDMDTYLEAKGTMNPGPPKPSGHNARKHLLSGFVICALCGVVMQCNGRNYQCTTKNTRNGVRGCGKVSRSRARLDDLITNLVIAYLEQQDLEAEESVADNWSPQVEEANMEIEAIHDAYQSGQITTADWLAGLKTARAKLADLEAGQLEALASLIGRAVREVVGSDARQRWEVLNLSQKRAVLADLLEAIVVRPSGRGRVFDPAYVEVIWRAK